MTVNIRVKLAGLLVAVALVPLLVALAGIVIGVGRLQRESFGEKMFWLASAQADILRLSVTKDIEKLHTVLEHDPAVAKFLLGQKKLSSREIAKLDADWPALPTSSRAMTQVLKNPIANVLRLIQEDDPRVKEIFVTDRFGQLAAATGRTTDFYQADEGWWQSAYHEGRGQVFVPPVRYDASAQVWGIELCVPILHSGEVAGVVKAVLDITPWAADLRAAALQESAEAVIVRTDGVVAYREGTSPGQTRIDETWTEVLSHPGPDWHLTKDGMLLAHVPMSFPTTLFASMPVATPHWILVLATEESVVLRSVRRLTLLVLFAGLAIILGLYLGGLYLVDRSIGRRIQQLRHVTGMVARGDLTPRLPPDWGGRRLLGPDEISDLANDFNRMIDAVQHSHDVLQTTNAMKTNFIRIASHELRTPVSYMLGMTRLLAGTADPERLRQALQAMGAKARRLEETIRAMFKLMPEQRYTEDLRYGEVDVPKLLAGTRQDCAPFLERRRQQMKVDLAENLPAIQADEDKVRDIIENLVMNAIKFSPDGGTIRVSAAEELGGYLRISVADCGPGIPQNDLPNIFDPFFSTRDVMKHSSGEGGYQKRGMGLGLAIVKHFVDLHGGRVSVSTGPKGTVFTVLLPVEARIREERPDRPGG